MIDSRLLYGINHFVSNIGIEIFLGTLLFCLTELFKLQSDFI